MNLNSNKNLKSFYRKIGGYKQTNGANDCKQKK